jgi:hypothetical protein
MMKNFFLVENGVKKVIFGRPYRSRWRKNFFLSSLNNERFLFITVDREIYFHWPPLFRSKESKNPFRSKWSKSSGQEFLCCAEFN